MMLLLVIGAFLMMHVQSASLNDTSTEDRSFKTDEVGKLNWLTYWNCVFISVILEAKLISNATEPLSFRIFMNFISNFK